MNFSTININNNLSLRALTPEVYSFVFSNYNEEQLIEFFGLTTPEEFEKEKNRFEKGMTTVNKTFILFHILENGKNVGWCGFHTWYTDHARAEIGYVLSNEASKGKGIMSAALKAVVDYGFNNMNLHRIEAFVAPNNVPSLKLMEKYNFTKEGHLREHYFKNNKMEDSVVFSLLKSEYKQTN